MWRPRGTRRQLFAHRRRELRRDEHPAAQRFAQGLDAGGFVDRRPDYREVEPVDRTDIAVKHLAEMECQIDRGGGLAGFAPRRVQPVDSAHCFGRCVECLMADLVPGRILEWEDRQHAIAEEFEHLTAARAQRGGQRLEDLVEKFDDHFPRGRVGDRREGADIGKPQDRADFLDRAALDGPGMNPPPGIGAEIGFEQAGGDGVAGMRHHRQRDGGKHRL